ncbi:TIGR02285 family protein [Paucibacter sp. DJ2R-2]|uniref:TIGR02285 family protein n=1 Tax=Paucibacter sp. DJ2R-2 TaxID=2893558 RepID=UPI0021E4823D|nr:TIGR02285 family protein [Paucibacter sp. DJ2R-2]MCV2419615.1 TIGR02285 family protein [Paucibacter sp. DJ4R-1]MCV2437481.1 TIGR02285 family protein [Paucibacter sp. DJ2R-2]
MRVHRSWLWLALLALLALAPGVVRAQPVMSWALQDFAPIYMPVDGKPGDGINDALLKDIVREMPGMEHRYVVASAARIYALLDAGEPICFVGGLRTPEREQLYWLSDVKLAPPLQLIAHRRVLKQLPLDGAGRVRLPELLARPGLRGVLVSKRSYGVALDAQLAQRPAGATVSMLGSGSMGSNFYDMLRLDRADYTLDYDFMLLHRQRLDGHKHEDLVILPIQGNDLPVRVVAACPRTPWGLAAIQRIDHVLAGLARTAGLGLPDPRWTTPEVDRLYGPAMRAFNLTRRVPTPGLGAP